MKIENNGPTPVTPKRTENIQRAGKPPARHDAASAISGKDRAEVTERARLLARARAALEAAPEADRTDSERLAALKQQIDSGTYQIPYEELARRMLAKINLSKPDGAE